MKVWDQKSVVKLRELRIRTIRRSLRVPSLPPSLFVGTPDAQLNPKKKVFEQVQPDFLVNEEGVATYRGIPFTVVGKGVCRAATMRGTGIK